MAINNDENSIDFMIKDGRKVRISLDVSGEEICVKNEEGKPIGRFELRLMDGDWPQKRYYVITWMYLDMLDSSYRKNGIGRKALCFHRESFNSPICTADDDGIRRDDGSHLTGDALGFVQQMRAEGIVSNSYWGERDD